MKRNHLFFILALVLFSFASGCRKVETGTPPASTAANFTAEVMNQGYAPCDVKFTNLSLYATAYSWDFGNGQTSTEKEPVTHYDLPGLYTVKLTCTPINNVYYNKLEKTLVVNVKDPLAGRSQVLYFTSRSATVGNGHMVILTDGIPLVQDFEPTDMERPYGIAADTTHNKVYITDYSMGAIYRFDADGKNPQKILDINVPGQEIVGDPEAIFVLGDKIYWGRTGGIYRANLDGSNPEAFIITGTTPPEYPIDMQYDPISNKIYLVNDKTDYSGGYWSVDFDGSGSKEILPAIDGTALEVDFTSGKTYFAIYGSVGSPVLVNGIFESNIDGTNLTQIGDFGAKATWGVAIDYKRSKLFWSYKKSNSDPDGKIVRANLDGSSPEDWLTGVSPHAMTIVWIKL